MFNSFKKWVRSDDNLQLKQETPVGLHAMHFDLQKKFSKGVQYNLKIIIRGDRNSGKSCLWHRLQGHKFVEEYIPTAEIQVASIHWNYKATDDIVKVDVWDIVDKGKPKQQSNSLKISHNGDDADNQCMLDASFLDVYKGSHAVLMVFDITKKWTFQYVERELPKIPPHIPVLVLANHRDMGSHRVIRLDEVEELVENTQRPPGSAGIFFIESSMKSGFGLKFVHKFFNLPFLLVQRESLLKQLATNHLDVESCLEELHYESTCEDQSYDHHLRMHEEKQKQAKKPKPPSDVSRKMNGEEDPVPTSLSRTSIAPNQPQTRNPPSSLAIKEETPTDPTKASGGLFSPSMMSTEMSSPTEQLSKEPERKGFMSRFFKSSSAPKPDVRKSSESEASVSKPSVVEPVSHEPIDVDEFVPENDDDDNFFNEVPDSGYSKREVESDESSTDEDRGNPMVAGFQEELDSDDQIPTDTHKVYSYSDSDDDYATSQKTTSKNHPVLSRLTGNSSLTPVRRTEDEKLQRLHIDSDTSEGDSDRRPYVMPDEDDVSDGEVSLQDKISSPAIEPTSNVVASISSGSSDANESVRVRKVSSDSSKPKLNYDQPHDVALSSDEESNAHMVSTVVEDVIDDDKSSSINCEEPPEQKMTFNLQTSDLDFLEQISTAPKESKPAPSKAEKAAKKKKKHKEKEETENVSKKSKHKKKKNKDTGEAKQSKKKSKKATEKKSAEDAALEEFLASGEGYESI